MWLANLNLVCRHLSRLATTPPAEFVNDENSKGGLFYKGTKEFVAKALNFSSSFFLKNLL
jgi:hypothetical protein